MPLFTNDAELISVIIPVYNGAAFVATAIESVLCQDYQPFEIIVVDDGSTDDTAAVVSQFGDSVRYLYQTNSGPAAARNTGINAATGELIAFLDHDDFWTPDKLSVQARYLQCHPEAGYVLARMRVILEPGMDWPSSLNREHYAQDSIGFLLGTVLIRQAALMQVGFFDPTLYTAEDVDWFARAQDYGIQKGLIDAVLLHKRIHGANISLTARENTQNLLRVLRRSTRRKQCVENEGIDPSGLDS